MRQTISGLVAALALMTLGAAPTLACGGLDHASCSPCGGQGYVSPCEQAYAPAPVYSGCGGGCGVHERLADPVTQYYYANQGPTYSGPGDYAPVPTYQESAVSGWDAYRHHSYHYGYDGGRYADATHHYYDGAGVDGPRIYSYPAHRHFRPWGMHHHYGYMHRPSYRYGDMPHHGMRYGANVGMLRHSERMTHRYYR